MDRLILMRHGKAERQAAAGGDFERPLAERGREDAALMAGVLARAKLAPDLILVSSARRTRETWEAVRDAFPQAAGEIRKDLYHAEAEDIQAAIDDEAGDGQTVMVIGHNPGLHDLAVTLALSGRALPGLVSRLRSRFPTSTAAVFKFDAAGTPTLDGLYYAAENGGHGGE
jgi:phosphohistidine phosphatase